MSTKANVYWWSLPEFIISLKVAEWGFLQHYIFCLYLLLDSFVLQMFLVFMNKFFLKFG